MFREKRRAKQAISAEECKTILRTANRAVLSVIGDDGYPYGVPVNYFYDDAEETLYIHGARTGHKVDSIRKNNKVCFTTWDQGHKEDGDWAWYVNSVIVMGEAELVSDSDQIAKKVRTLGGKYYPTAEDLEQEIKADIDHVQLIAVHIQHMTGKRVHEK